MHSDHLDLCAPAPRERKGRPVLGGDAGLTQLAEEQGHAAAADGQGVSQRGLDDLPVTGPQRDGSLWKETDWCSVALTRPMSAQCSVASGGPGGLTDPEVGLAGTGGMAPGQGHARPLWA